MSNAVLADYGRPVSVTAVYTTIVIASKPLLEAVLAPELASAVFGLLTAIGPLLGFFIPRRSVERKVQMVREGRDPITKAGKRGE